MKLLRSADSRADRRQRNRPWLVRVLVAGFLIVAAALPVDTLTTAPAQAAGGTTVPGPNVWIPDPETGDGLGYTTGTYGDPGTVTVDHTQNITNEVLHVSWTGFTPTIDPSGSPVTVVAPSTSLYPVRIYECRGTNPTVTDCYGSSHYQGDPAKGFDQISPEPGTTSPDFLSNEVLAATGSDGSGGADIEVWTSKESPTLGCDSSHACSIVVEPNYGGDALGFATDSLGNFLPPNCDNHSQDTAYSNAFEATDNPLTMSQDPTTGFASGERCAWKNHVVIPLSFAPTAGDCKASRPDFSAEGLPMFARAGAQWIAGLCLDKNPLAVQYSANLTEPQARTDFLQGINSDVALTARPAEAGSAHTHPYIYAPLANSSIAVVFLIDDPNTGVQVRSSMKLNARLMAKMLTQSYQLRGYDGAPVTKSVDGNPYCLFADPEFQQLNPPDPNGGPAFPTNCPNGADSAPIVTGGQTDLVYQLTSWIAADPDARAFLQGAPDPWGMHVDTYYLPSIFPGYPVESLVPQDSSGYYRPGDLLSDPNVAQGELHAKSFEWNPVQAGLSQVARNLLTFQATCVVPQLGQDGQFDKCPPETIGSRSLIGIVDAGQAAAYRMPTASLLNPSGAFVQPTLSGMANAVGDMVTDKATGTQSLPYGLLNSSFAKDPGAYPLTTVQYAMVPTGGVSATKAAKIAQFVRTTTSSSGGQVYGAAPGQLAPGYLTLTPAQQAQATAAAQHVADQDGTPSPVATHPTGGGGGGSANRAGTTAKNGTGGNPVSVAGRTPASQLPAAGSATAARARNQSLGPLSVTGVAHPDQADPSRLVLPLALIAGLLFLLGGPLGAVLLGTGAGGQLAQRLRNAASGRR